MFQLNFVVCILQILVSLVWAGEVNIDDDTTLEFYWTKASGTVKHYNVYVSVYDNLNGVDNFVQVGETSRVPTASRLYALPMVAQHGKFYRVKVEAENAQGKKGPMSDPSDFVYCFLREKFIPGHPVRIE
jgi:hypothetical protein